MFVSGNISGEVMFMTAMWIVLVSVLVVIFGLLFLKITVEAVVDKENGEKTKTDFKLLLAGIEIDVTKFFNNKKTTEVLKQYQANVEKETDESDGDSFAEKLAKFRVNIARGKYTYLLSKRYVRKKIAVENLDFSIRFGLGDAAQTGIATGAVWGAIYNIFSFIDSLVIVKSHNFNVTPVFECSGIAYKFNAKIQCRIVNIIAVAITVLMNYIKTGRNL